MKYARSSFRSLLLGTLALTASGAVGCNYHLHPEDRAAVYHVLDQNDLSSVEVSESRVWGVITLRGVVVTAANKAKAEQLVRQAAPGYSVNNQLQVKSNG